MTHSKIILKINDANFQGICTSCCIVKDEQTLIALIYEPKTLSETMNEQSYYETMYILRPDIAEDEVTSHIDKYNKLCLLYTSPSPRDQVVSRMPSSA